MVQNSNVLLIPRKGFLVSRKATNNYKLGIKLRKMLDIPNGEALTDDSWSPNKNNLYRL